LLRFVVRTLCLAHLELCLYDKCIGPELGTIQNLHVCNIYQQS
jgi:hypothetical protein